MSPTLADAPTRTRRRSGATWTLVGLLAFQGLGAISGGLTFLADASGASAGLDPGLLARTPFDSFLWPGALLALGLGAPALVLVHAVLRRPRLAPLDALERATGQHWSWAGTLLLGVALLSWITVQVLLIETSWLQPLMFAVGAALVGLPLTSRVRRDLECRDERAAGPRDAHPGPRVEQPRHRR